MENTECEVTWRNLELRAKNGKHILRDVCGQIKPHTLTAVMGPSGSGKTTLLDCIAGRTSTQMLIEGSIVVNGHERSIETWPTLVAYVGQDFYSYEWQTVYETLIFVASVRILGKEQAGERVDDLIVLLGLRNVQETFIAKLNGVERIKLNLGIELLKEPSIILLDEPTTGLDSSSALNVLSVIKKIADLGKTVLITIHQPSCKMLSYFDKIILMSRGSVVFQGKLDRCIDFFAECGHECPVKTTPSEFFLDILALDPKNDDKIDDSVKRINSIKKEWDFIKDIEEPTIKEEVQVSLQPPLSTSFEMILKRSVVNFFRNFPYIKMKLIQKAIIACLFGATFYGLGVVKADVFSFRGVMTFLFQGELFGVTSPIFNLFHMEKKIIRRERMSGLYSGYQIFYAKFISEALLHFIYAIPYNLIIYILVGLRREVSVMLSFFIIIFTIIIYSISFALFISIVTSSTSSAQVVGMTLNVVFLIYSGAFSNPTKLPSPLKWIVWASPLHYAFRAILYNQLGDLKTTVSAPTPLIVYGRDTLKYFGLKGCEMWESIFYLLLYSIAFQVLGATILHYGTVNNLKLSKKAGVDQI